MTTILQYLIEPGFFTSAPVHAALVTGAIVALVSGAVGMFTVLRSQSFAGHAMSDMGTLGGSAAYLAGTNPLWGFVGIGVIVAGLMDLFGAEQKRSRDISTGIVLGAILGLSALLLYLDTTESSTTGATISILFGSLFAVTGYTVPATVALGLIGAGALTLLYRPLLLTSVSNDLAAARGIRVRLLGVVFLLTMGVSVSLASLTVGTILSPALLIGPAATALRITRRPFAALVTAGAIGLSATWLGILLAYDSYHWPPTGTDGWPVSFFIMTLIFLAYLASGLGENLRNRRRTEPRPTGTAAREA
jgi:zinc/manganese transport system permease protein